MAEKTPENPLHALEVTLNAAQSERKTAQKELETAGQNWRGLPGELNALREEERQLGKEADRNRARLDELKSAIADKEQKENGARTRLREAYQNLAKKEWAVTKAAAAFNSKAIGFLLKFIIKACKNSPISTAGVSYGSFTAGGNAHQYVLFSFEGSEFSDVLFPVSLLSLVDILIVSIVIVMLLAVLVRLPIPVYAEVLTSILRTFAVKVPQWTILILLFGVFPVAGTVTAKSSIPTLVREDIVCIQRIDLPKENGQPATSPELPKNVQQATPLNQQAMSPKPPKNGEQATTSLYLKTEEFILISSNSTYMFVKKEGEENNSAESILLSDIIAKKVNDGEWERGAAALQYELAELVIRADAIDFKKLSERADTIDGELKGLRQEHQNIIDRLPGPIPHAPPEFDNISKRMDAIDGEFEALHEDHKTLREEHKRLASDPHLHPEFGEISKRLDVHVHDDFIIESQQVDSITTTMKMICRAPNHIQLSGPIRFRPDEPETNSHAPSSPHCKDGSSSFPDNSLYRKAIKDFVNLWKGKEPTYWTIFRFPGKATGNNGLSECRAEMVKNTMGFPLDEAQKPLFVLDETLSSRSLRVAVCAKPSDKSSSPPTLGNSRLKAIQPDPLEK